jgi:hypothetical protein
MHMVLRYQSDIFLKHIKHKHPTIFNGFDEWYEIEEVEIPCSLNTITNRVFAST